METVRSTALTQRGPWREMWVSSAQSWVGDADAETQRFEDTGNHPLCEALVSPVRSAPDFTKC